MLWQNINTEIEKTHTKSRETSIDKSTPKIEKTFNHLGINYDEDEELLLKPTIKK